MQGFFSFSYYSYSYVTFIYLKLDAFIYTFISVRPFFQKCVSTFGLLASVTTLIMYNYKSV